MSQILCSRITLSVFSVFALFACGARAQATDISGIIATTLTIFEDSELVGDVTCTVADAPCIAFGAPGIKFCVTSPPSWLLTNGTFAVYRWRVFTISHVAVFFLSGSILPVS